MFGIHFVLPRNLQVPLSFQALIVKKKKKKFVQYTVDGHYNRLYIFFFICRKNKTLNKMLI